MIRRPPNSTLFPSPTLSRSVCTRGNPADFRGTSSARSISCYCCYCRRATNPSWLEVPHENVRRDRPPRRPVLRRRLRSEEHTSELQSQSNLVCRLLLEKKKK